jgi:hypothetical protein
VPTRCPSSSYWRAGGEGSARTETVSATEKVSVRVSPSSPVTVTSSLELAVSVPFIPGSMPDSLR